jgi:hypothetical protein
MSSGRTAEMLWELIRNLCKQIVRDCPGEAVPAAGRRLYCRTNYGRPVPPSRELLPDLGVRLSPVRAYFSICSRAADSHACLECGRERGLGSGQGGHQRPLRAAACFLPKEIQPADEAYRARLRAAFEEHKTSRPDAFDHFVEAQLAWDESMAASAAEYLEANQGRRMVILADSGHVEFGSGVPSRLERRLHVTYAIVLNSGVNIEQRIADYILLGNRQQLPPAGVLGAQLEEKGGECRIRSLDPAGAAEKAGLKAGDFLLDIDGEPVKTTADVRLALWKKNPGDRIMVSIRRGTPLKGTRKLEVELAAPSQGDVKR